MKCPYCNKKLIITCNGLACLNVRCEKSRGMFGTELMWEKVSQLAKIRKAGDRWRATHRQQKSEYQRGWYQRKKGDNND